MATNEAIYPLDPEHWKLRVVVFGAFFSVAMFIIVLTPALLGGDGLSIIGVLGGLIGGYLASALAERFLKGRWHSSRSLRVSNSGVRLMKGETVEQEVPITSTIVPLRWKFTITRRTRVPKGWWMYACSLAAGDRQITVYTFISPKDNELFSRADQFARLHGKKEIQKAGAAPPQNLRQAGEERRLREAEEHRWLAGGEMSFSDFTDLLDRLDQQFQEWTPVSS
ncbi:MAG: hypothetical protein JNL34_08960 [Anaerolineae bacterium]|nr:hypothetical protein [Anaerolineae bacterium]